MAHYSRLATRKSETPKAWLKTCSQIGELANNLSGRGDLAVYGGEDAGMGEALACFIHSTAEIEINLPIAFGKATTPEMVGDLRERSAQYDFPEAVGVIYHEALHARLSSWKTESVDETMKDNPLSQQIADAFWLLEESRIEAYGVVLHPENQLFLRASAMGLSFGEAEEHLEKNSTTEAVGHLVGLTLSRVDAGVLDYADVENLYAKMEEVLTPDTLRNLRKIWREFQTLDADNSKDLLRGVELATEWVMALRKQAEENGETPSEPKGGCGIGIGSGSGEDEGNPEGSGSMSEVLKELLDAMAEAMSETAMATADDLSNQQTKEEWGEQVKQTNQKAKDRKTAEDTASKVFSNSSGGGGTSSSSRLVEVRKPEPAERAGAVKLAQMLEKAKYVERSTTEVKSVVPQGRLRTRAVVQKKALEAKGVRSEVPTWEHKVRKHTDDPTLSIGVMVDISGSMSSAMKPMASIAWILSEAGRRVQARTAMVYYGNAVFPTLKVGQHLEEVKVYSAPDGTEEFDTAYKALNGSLGLTYGSGVRMLVIVSDGHYTSEQDSKARQAIKECEQNGVAVLFISPDAVRYGGASDLVKGTHAIHLDGVASTDQIAMAIGKSATEALAKVGGSQR
jgi:hypothetical protein